MSIYQKRETYRKDWDNAHLSTPEIPLNIDIELTSICNLNCPMCFIADLNFRNNMKKKSRIMNVDLAKEIITEAAEIGVPALKFNWRGEPTLHPFFSGIVEFARNKSVFHDLLVNTNANCGEESIPGLMAATKVMVSLDSMHQLIYLKMRRGGKLFNAKAIIHRLIREGHPNLWVRRVITKENIGEDFAGEVRKEFGDKVQVSEHWCFDRNAGQTCETLNMPKQELERIYCKYPSQRIVISTNGIAYPCCIDTDETMAVGDINHQTIKDIWLGERMADLRDNLKMNIFSSDKCRNCTSWMSYKTKKRDLVQDVNIKK